MRTKQACHIEHNISRTMNFRCWVCDLFLSVVAAAGKRIPGLFPVLLLLMVAGGAKGQFVDIQIDLPAATRVENMGSPTTFDKPDDTGRKPADFGLPADFGMLGSPAEFARVASLQWIGISVAENVQLTVAVSYKTLGKDENPVAAAYLNNGTVNIADAVPFDNRVVFQASDSGLLIRKMPRRTKSLTAWIGVPATQTRELMIEYN